MSGHQFVFPPPPPPPPPPPQSTPNHTKQGQPPTVQGVGYHGRGNRGDRPFRGRGRGNDRGGFRGGHDGDVGRSASQRNEGHFSFGYSPHGSGTAGGYPLPEYPPVQQPQYPANFESGYGHQTSHYPPAFAPPAPNRGYNDGPPKPLVFDGSWQNTNYTHKPPAYDVSYPHQELQNFNARPARPNHKVKPVVAGPPIHIAFQGDYKGVYQQAPFPAQAHPQPYQNQPNSYPPAIGLDSQSPFQQTPHATLFPNTRDPSNPSTGNRNRGQKRGHYDAFGRSRSSNPKTNAKSQVAPSVPSFGIPLPVKPPAPQETGRKSRKKKRRHNQLGLTPKTVEYESSEEEENDADEEAKLAAEAGIPGIESEQ